MEKDRQGKKQVNRTTDTGRKYLPTLTNTHHIKTPLTFPTHPDDAFQLRSDGPCRSSVPPSLCIIRDIIVGLKP
jgi:hypothetical protein